MNISKSVFSKKTRDYTFIVLFLLIFSVFIIFAINPSLKTAFSLKKEEKDLVKVDTLYEKKIMDISSIQSQIEENRDSLFLINEAISEYPEVNKMVDDVKTIADKNSLMIRKANIDEVSLSQSKKKLEAYKIWREMVLHKTENYRNTDYNKLKSLAEKLSNLNSQSRAFKVHKR